MILWTGNEFTDAKDWTARKPINFEKTLENFIANAKLAQ